LRIWVTRALPQATATAARLVARGHDPVVVPVIETRPARFGLEDFAGAGALALTSQAGVAAIAAFAPRLCVLPVFAVGDATATAARQAGFDQVYSASGRVEGLVALILAHPSLGLILHASAALPAGDLVGDLVRAGQPARRLVVYETVPTAIAAMPDQVDAIMIHSAQAAKAVAAMILPYQTATLHLYGLSSDAVLPLAAFNFAKIAVARFANEESILSLL
jgi:uroporphyrinogen-III synthase